MASMKIRSSLAGLSCLAASVCGMAPGEAQARAEVLDRPFLELLGYIEGPEGYNQLSHYVTAKPIRPISTLSINQVLDYQRMLRQQGAKSTAVGRYQFIYKTLLHLTKIHKIDRNRKFDSHMQDYLARLEMERCGYYDPSIKVTKLGNCLASVWAALPLLDGKHRGKSKYEKMKINSSQTSPLIVEAILNNRFPSSGHGTSPRSVKIGDIVQMTPAVAVSSSEFKPIMIPDTPVRSMGSNKLAYGALDSTGNGKKKSRSVSRLAVTTSLRPVARTDRP